jgi:hypothetical protein
MFCHDALSLTNDANIRKDMKFFFMSPVMPKATMAYITNY